MVVFRSSDRFSANTWGTENNQEHLNGTENGGVHGTQASCVVVGAVDKRFKRTLEGSNHGMLLQLL